MTGTRLLFGIATVLIIAGLARAEEPLFEGQPAEWWAEKLKFKPEGFEPEEARVRLARGGGKAAPVLVRMIERGKELDMSVKAAQILNGIAIHDPAAAPALIRCLVPLMAEGDHSFAAGSILKLLAVAHPGARTALKEELLRQLERTNAGLSRMRLQNLLAELANETPEDLEQLLRVLFSGNADPSVIRALQKQGLRVLPRLVELLPTADDDALFYVYQLLISMKVPAAELFSALLPAPMVRGSEAAKMVAMLLFQKSDAPGVTFEHRRRLFGQLEELRLALIPKFEADAKSAPEFAEFVSEQLADQSVQERVRGGLLFLVSKMKPEQALLLLPQAIDGLSDPYPPVRVASAGAIGAIGPAAAKAAPHLMVGLEDNAEMVPAACAVALARIGPNGIGELRRLLASGLPKTRALGALGLGAVPDALRPESIALLEKTLEGEEDLRVREIIEKALQQLRE